MLEYSRILLQPFNNHFFGVRCHLIANWTSYETLTWILIRNSLLLLHDLNFQPKHLKTGRDSLWLFSKGSCKEYVLSSSLQTYKDVAMHSVTLYHFSISTEFMCCTWIYSVESVCLTWSCLMTCLQLTMDNSVIVHVETWTPNNNESVNHIGVIKLNSLVGMIGHRSPM